MSKFLLRVFIKLVSLLLLTNLLLCAAEPKTDNQRRQASNISGQILKQQHQLLAALRSRQFAQRLPTTDKPTIRLTSNNSSRHQLPTKHQGEQLVSSSSQHPKVQPARVSVVKTQIKRQTDAQTDRPKHHISKRNEDPWFLDQDSYPLQPYRFVYNIRGKDGQSQQFRQEVGDGKYVTGSYGYFLPDGIYRHVDYVADDRGFRAYIRTSEPGTANQNPADVVINSNPVRVPITPSVTYATPGGPRSIDPAIIPAPYPGYTTPSVSDQLAQVRRPPGSIVAGDRSNLTGPFSIPNLTGGYIDPARFDQRPAGFNITSNNLLQGSGWSTIGSSVDSPIRRFDTVTITTPPPFLASIDPSLSARDRTQSGLVNQDSFRLAPDNIERYRQQDSARLTPTIQPQDSFGQGPASNVTRFGSISNLLPSGLGSDRRTELSANRFSASSFPSSQGASKGATNLLLYDQIPVPGSGVYSSKLNYDVDYLRHPDSSLLSYERARHLAHLEQLNARSRLLNGLSVPLPLAPLSPSLGSLEPSPRFKPLTVDSRPMDSSYHQGNSFGSLSHGNEYQSEQHRRFELGGGVPGGSSLSRESYSGTKSGSGKTIEFGRQSGKDHEIPPLPQFSPNPSQMAQPPQPEDLSPLSRGLKASGITDGIKAPYSIIQQQEEERHPAEGRGSSAETTRYSLGSSVQMQAPVALAEEQSRTAPVLPSKLGLERSARWLTLSDGRLGDKLRSTIMLNDWRKMQSSLGLPQPPRSKATSSELTKSARVEISATKPTKSQIPPTGEITRVSLSTGPLSFKASPDGQSNLELSKLFEDDKVNSIDGSDLLVANNGSSFDARRLTSNMKRQATNLQAEKLSELEKFQQRLRAQQLLLDQSQKQQSELEKHNHRASPRTNSSLIQSKQQLAGPQAQRPNGNGNSQVNYDEDLDNGGQQVRSASSSNKQPATETKAQQLDTSSDFAAKLKSWPSLMSNQTLEPIGANSAGLRQQPQSVAPKAGGTMGTNSTIGNQTAIGSKPAGRPNGPANTINLDFINSVTALSVDQLNPFALTSVNPALHQLKVSPAQQSPQASDQLISVKSNGRLTPHKLEPSIGSSINSIATSNARFFSSPELLAAMNHHERVDTSGQMRGLLSMSSFDPGDGAAEKRGETVSSIHRDSSTWASNHRYPSTETGATAPYMLTQSNTEARGRTPVKRHVMQSKVIQMQTNGKDEHLASNHQFYEIATSSSTLSLRHAPSPKGFGFERSKL